MVTYRAYCTDGVESAGAADEKVRSIESQNDLVIVLTILHTLTGTFRAGVKLCGAGLRVRGVKSKVCQ